MKQHFAITRVVQGRLQFAAPLVVLVQFILPDINVEGLGWPVGMELALVSPLGGASIADHGWAVFASETHTIMAGNHVLTAKALFLRLERTEFIRTDQCSRTVLALHMRPPVASLHAGVAERTADRVVWP